MTTLHAYGRYAAILSSTLLFGGYVWYQGRTAQAANAQAAHESPLAAPGAPRRSLTPEQVRLMTSSKSGMVSMPEFAFTEYDISLYPYVQPLPASGQKRTIVMSGSKSSAADFRRWSSTGSDPIFYIIEPQSEPASATVPAQEAFTYSNAPNRPAQSPSQTQKNAAAPQKRTVIMSGSKSPGFRSVEVTTPTEPERSAEPSPRQSATQK